MEKLDALQRGSCRLPIILLYVYNARDVGLDSAVRSHVDSVFYKPVEISAVSRRIEELLPV
jgi:response regulator RpfG family c-di-GMP phosphodiesterase